MTKEEINDYKDRKIDSILEDINKSKSNENQLITPKKSNIALNNFIESKTNELKSKKIKNELNLSNQVSVSFNHSVERIKNQDLLTLDKPKSKDNANLGLLESAKKYYGSWRAFKDFFLHLLTISHCNCKMNRRVYLEKEHYESRINKLLSINYIFKKFFMLEILVAKNFTSDQLSMYNAKYLFNLLNCKNDVGKMCYDDSNAFSDFD